MKLQTNTKTGEVIGLTGHFDDAKLHFVAVEESNGNGRATGLVDIRLTGPGHAEPVVVRGTASGRRAFL